MASSLLSAVALRQIPICRQSFSIHPAWERGAAVQHSGVIGVFLSGYVREIKTEAHRVIFVRNRFAFAVAGTSGVPEVHTL